jgi:uncharacterized protein (UPF0261 family)
MKTVAIIAALDTKGEEAQFIGRIISERGHRCVYINVGVLGEPSVPVDDCITSAEVAHAGGIELTQLCRSRDKAAAMETMTRGAPVIALRLLAANKLDAIIGIGGGAGTVIGSSAMRALPVGVPKVLVSTLAAGDVGPYVGTRDLTLMYSVVDVAGLNRVLAKVLANAAGAIVGMLDTEAPQREERPLIAASMFGNTTQCVDRARQVLEAEGFEVLVFHATGAGGRTMEGLIADGYITGVLDLTTTEWADELCGGVMGAGPGRLDAAAHAGVPQVVAPGCLDMVNFWAPDTVPAHYRERNLYHWNPNVTLMRTDVAENRELGRIFAEKVSQSSGPVTVLLPLGGVSQLDSAGGPFFAPAADEALFAAIKEGLRADIRVIELPANINDPVFAETAAAELLRLIRGKTAGVTASAH